MRSNSVLRNVPIGHRDIKTWPRIDEGALPEKKLSLFLRNRKAITAALAEASYREIQKETGLKPSDVRRLLNRCLQPDGMGKICGERALVPHVHIACYTRSKPVQREIRSGRGYCSGALGQLFNEYPEIEERIIQEVLKQLPERTKVSEAKISIVHLHKVFLAMCERIEGASGRWPFNTKTKGRSSLAAYLHNVAHDYPLEFIRARFGKDSAVRTGVGNGVRSTLVPQLPYDIWEADEFRFDFIGTIVLPVAGGGEQDIPIEAIHIVVVVDRGSEGICGWHPFFRASAQSADMRQAIQNALTPWIPWTFSIPGLTYGVQDAGMPSGIIASTAYHPPVMLVLDNALAHQDICFLDDLGATCGCIVGFGPVGQWSRRATVERRIKELLAQSAQRLPSTTGNNPKDPKKNDPAGTAVKLRIRWQDVSQVVECVISQQNAMPSEGIGMLTPIELLRQHFTDPTRGYLVRPLPLEQQNPTCLSTQYEEVVVRGSIEKGRRPFIRLDRANYTNQVLATSWKLIGKKLRIAINNEDFRTLDASVLGSGAILGQLQVQGAWSKTKHTRAMRKEINQLRSRRIFAIPPGVDPVAIYLEYLADKARLDARKLSKGKLSKAGSRLAEIHDRTGLTVESLNNQVSENEPQQSIEPSMTTLTARKSLRDLQWEGNECQEAS